MTEPTKFARLEEHDGLQVLAFVEAKESDSGDYGPCLMRRCDPSISITTTLGPWPDDEGGWDATEKALADMDMASYVAECRKLAERFGGEG